MIPWDVKGFEVKYTEHLEEEDNLKLWFYDIQKY